MSDDVDALFGGRTPPRPTFTERLARGQFLPSQENPPPAADDSTYKPYGFLPANTVGEVCEVRGWVAGTDVPQGIVFQYRFLMQVGFVGDELLKLMLPDAIVVIEGRQLGELRRKLSRRMVTFIQQHHARIWPPAPADEPLIARIEVMRPGENGRRSNG